MSKPDQMSQSYVMSDDAVRFATMIMAGQGVSNEDAAIIAECLVEADLRGGANAWAFKAASLC